MVVWGRVIGRCCIKLFILDWKKLDLKKDNVRLVD